MKESSCITEQPIVTVITATFNLCKGGRAEAFRKCVRSVHEQTYGNIEHLVIDGASTDGTLELAREYEQQGWLTVHSEPDKGIYDAFNKGIRKAQGKYIAFLNSDDWWHDPRGVAASVELLQLTGAAFSYAPSFHVNETEERVWEHCDPMSIFFIQAPFCHQTMFCRTELLRELGCFEDSYRIIADYDVLVQILLKGERGVRVPLNFTSFRMTGLSSGNEVAELIDAEDRKLYRRLYGPFVTEEEMPGIRKGLLPNALMDAFSQMLHPTLFAELKQHCYWDKQSMKWHYCMGRTSWGPLELAQIELIRRIKRKLTSFFTGGHQHRAGRC